MEADRFWLGADWHADRKKTRCSPRRAADDFIQGPERRPDPPAVTR